MERPWYKQIVTWYHLQPLAERLLAEDPSYTTLPGSNLDGSKKVYKPPTDLAQTVKDVCDALEWREGYFVYPSLSLAYPLVISVTLSLEKGLG